MDTARKFAEAVIHIALNEINNADQATQGALCAVRSALQENLEKIDKERIAILRLLRPHYRAAHPPEPPVRESR